MEPDAQTEVHVAQLRKRAATPRPTARRAPAKTGRAHRKPAPWRRERAHRKLEPAGAAGSFLPEVGRWMFGSGSSPALPRERF